ncbi:MAG: hypothetical protein QM736_22555 [Vicinamibacterales bacterium]
MRPSMPNGVMGSTGLERAIDEPEDCGGDLLREPFELRADARAERVELGRDTVEVDRVEQRVDPRADGGVHVAGEAAGGHERPQVRADTAK